MWQKKKVSYTPSKVYSWPCQNHCPAAKLKCAWVSSTFEFHIVLICSFFIFYYVHYMMLCYTMTPWQVWFLYIGLLLELYGPDGEDVSFLSEKCTKYLQCGLISKITFYIIQMNIMRMEWSFPSAKVMNKLWWSTHFFRKQGTFPRNYLNFSSRKEQQIRHEKSMLLHL